MAQLLPLLNGIARLREAITGTTALDMDRAAHLGLVLFMIASVLISFGRFARSSRRDSNRSPSRAATSTRASSLLLLVVTATALTMPLRLSAQASAVTISDSDIRRIVVDRVDTHGQALALVVGIIGASGRRARMSLPANMRR